MTKHANRCYAMPEACEIEENFEILKEMIVNLRQTVKLLEQEKLKLENHVQVLTDSNKSLKESSDRLLAINDTQRMMIDKFDQSLNKINLLKTEVDELKKENSKLKSCVSNETKSHTDTIENYNLLLQKKIADLEKQLLQNQTLHKENSSLHSTKHEKELSLLKNKNQKLYFENKSLEEQLTNFRTLHHQIISEIRLKNPKYTNNQSQQVRNNTKMHSISPIDIDMLDEDELQPIQVHVIDSDVD